MLELLKFIFEVCQEIVKLATEKKDKKFKDMGKNLLLIYVYMNEVTESAYRVVEFLKKYVECVDSRMSKHGEDIDRASEICDLSRLKEITESHAFSLEKLYDQICEFDIEFSILDDDLKKKIFENVGYKATSFSTFLFALRTGNWHVALNRKKFLKDFNSDPGFHKFRNTNHHIMAVGDVTGTKFTLRNYQNIKRFIEVDNPDQQIRELDNLRKEVKGLTEKYWQIPDLLPDVKKEIIKSRKPK
jgi:hypothetical protein